MSKTILVPIELSSSDHIDQGKKMIEVAKRLADKEVQIMLVNAVEDIPAYVAAELPRGILEKSRESARSMLKDIARAAGLEANAKLLSGRAHSAILTAADEYKADLIVISSHQPGFQDYLLGSTASRVVRHAKCSVYVVREPDY